jgi:hypothetical protein
MRSFEVSPELLQQYAQLTQNEMLLHLAIKAMSEDGGPAFRNLAQICQQLGKTKPRLRDAEWGLKHKNLLRIHRVNGKRWWYIYDHPIGENETATKENPPIALPAVRQARPRLVTVDRLAQIDAPKKRRSVFRKLRDALVGSRLDDFEIEPE